MRSLSCLLFLLLLMACTSDKDPKNIIIENQFSIDLPGYTAPFAGLREAALLEYANPQKEFYVTVVGYTKSQLESILENADLKVESAEPTLNDFAQLMTLSYFVEMKMKKRSELKMVALADGAAQWMDFERDFDQHRVYYQIQFVKIADCYYELMIWCLAEDKLIYADKMEAIRRSFRGTMPATTQNN